LWESDHFASSGILCYPEGRAALAGARRGRRLTSDQHRTAAGDFDATLGELHLLGVDLALTRHAGQLAADLGLRGYDAVHLASAFAIGADAVVTWDKTFRKGVRRSGLGVAPADEAV
jgi:predicted nucleic acid-binding protein